MIPEYKNYIPTHAIPEVMEEQYDMVRDLMMDEGILKQYGKYTLVHNGNVFMVYSEDQVMIGEIDGRETDDFIWMMEYCAITDDYWFFPRRGRISTSKIPEHAFEHVLSLVKFNNLKKCLKTENNKIAKLLVYTNGEHVYRIQPFSKLEIISKVGKPWTVSFDGECINLDKISTVEFVLDVLYLEEEN